MTNYLIQGGCADVVKVAMNRVDELLLGKKSRMVLTIHDELPCEVHESEVAFIPQQVKEIMETVFPYKYLPLTCGMEWSDKSLGDKKKGFPNG
jgi:DNA polymerase-1